MTELALLPVAADSADDCEAFARFVAEHFPGSFPVHVSTLRSGRMRGFWVRAGSTTVGVTAYIGKTEFLAETVKTVVHRDHRGKGYGEAISQLIEDEVRRRGFRKAMSTVYVTNLAMIMIKLRQGYIIEGYHPDHEKPGLHEYSLGKRL